MLRLQCASKMKDTAWYQKWYVMISELSPIVFLYFGSMALSTSDNRMKNGICYQRSESSEPWMVRTLMNTLAIATDREKSKQSNSEVMQPFLPDPLFILPN